jgi:hypothetical protein
MTPGAEVNAISVLADWLAAVCIYRTEGTESLTAVAMTIKHADDWLDEKLHFWQREKREADQEVVQAAAELRNRQIADFRGRIPDCSVQEENLRVAEARLQNADDQIRTVRKWMIQLPRLVNETYEAQARRLSRFLDTELTQAISKLDQQIRSLEAYVALQAPSK